MAKTTISATAAARRLGVNLNYLYDLVRVGRLEAKKKGRRWHIPEQSIKERLERLEAISK
jgi:excisionase family DNA binding protein